MMTETEFIDSIDCNFPYSDIHAATDLITQAGEISTNAIFMVLHEILRAPAHIALPSKELLFSLWLNEYEDQALYRFMRRCVPAYLKNELVPVGVVVQLIEQLAPHTGQLVLLGLCYFACDDKTGEAKAAYQTVLDLWQA